MDFIRNIPLEFIEMATVAANENGISEQPFSDEEFLYTFLRECRAARLRVFFDHVGAVHPAIRRIREEAGVNRSGRRRAQ